MQEARFRIRSKIWVENEEGKVVFGRGRFRILEAVDRLGSPQTAAGELKMRYRANWGRIKASEKRIGKPLLISDNKGSRLTPLAQKLLKQFRRVRTIVEKDSGEVYDSLISGWLAE